jgi:hypothetical protein
MRWPNPSTGSNKAELIFHEGPWNGVEDVEWATRAYVDWFNNHRIHNEIGKVPPAEFEAIYYRQNAACEAVPSQTTESLGNPGRFNAAGRAVAGDDDTTPQTVLIALIDGPFKVCSASRHVRPRSSPLLTSLLTSSIIRGNSVVDTTRFSLVRIGGPCKTRTCDPLRVVQVRYQLRQRPVTRTLPPPRDSTSPWRTPSTPPWHH